MMMLFIQTGCVCCRNLVLLLMQVPWCRAFFLTHFHSDHYGGLCKSWKAGFVYCSAITGALVIQRLGVSPSFVRVLPLDRISLVDGWEITTVRAHHCPGSVMFQFKQVGSAAGLRYLHTGDMRYDPSMATDPVLIGCREPDVIYLDTTYARPQ